MAKREREVVSIDPYIIRKRGEERRKRMVKIRAIISDLVKMILIILLLFALVSLAIGYSQNPTALDIEETPASSIATGGGSCLSTDC